MAQQMESGRKYWRHGHGRESEILELERQWKPIFDKYDADGDGQIPLEDIHALLHQGNTDLAQDVPKGVLDEIVERADWDNNGMLSYQEFKSMVNAHDLGEHRPRFHALVRYAARAVVPTRQRATVVRRYMDEYSCMPPPIFVMLVSLIEVIVFVYYCIVLNELTATGPAPTESPLIYNPKRRKEAWRFLTYMLIHVGGYHMFFNLIIQLILGIPLEMVHKWWRILIVYILGVIAGSLGSSISDPGVFLAGASGGVYSLLAAHLATVILNFKEMDFGWLRLVSLLIFAATDIGVAVYGRYYEEQEQNRVSYAAHLAGALAGLMVGIMFLRNLVVHKWEVVLGRVLFAVFLVLMIAAVLFNAFYPEYFPPPVV
ncbi:rhomboid-related protein 2-like [Ornithodoros turicata]|uniref:rhomboid-related protein 2-like n=1 Tax=Ornithodoros turicata TaxID=34597 RepID=UPI0031391FC9